MKICKHAKRTWSPESSTKMQQTPTRIGDGTENISCTVYTRENFYGSFGGKAIAS